MRSSFLFLAVNTHPGRGALGKHSAVLLGLLMGYQRLVLEAVLIYILA